MTILETARLRVREVDERDRAALRELFDDTDVMRHYPNLRAPDAGDRWATAMRALYARHGYGPWTVELLDGAFVGQCGPLPQRIDGVDEIELVCFFLRKFWRDGYADEAGEACSAHVVAAFGCPQPIALVGLDNRPSLRLAKRRGYRVERDVVVDGVPMTLLRRPVPQAVRA